MGLVQEYIFQSTAPYEYTGEHHTPFLDPLETEIQGHNVYSLSANATFNAPPAQRTGYARIWNKTTSQWVEMEDHRGTQYWLPDQKYGDQPHTMNELGPLPQGATTTEPEKTRQQKLDELLPAVKDALNDFAHTRGYDSMLYCVSYATSSNEYYKLEGLYGIQLRDETWEDANTKYQALVDDETLPVPTPEAFVATLPVASAEWPVKGDNDTEDK